MWSPQPVLQDLSNVYHHQMVAGGAACYQTAALALRGAPLVRAARVVTPHLQQQHLQRLHPPHNMFYMMGVVQHRPPLEDASLFQPSLISALFPYDGGVVANRTVSHMDILAGKGAVRGSWSIEKSKRTLEINSVSELHTLLQKHVMTSEQLDENSYPRPDPTRPGRALLRHIDPRTRITRADATRRDCVRCNRTYSVDEQGLQVLPEQCCYHWGRLYSRRGEKKYSCCSLEAPAEGCCVADAHVSDNFDPDNMTGYQETFSKPEGCASNTAVYALDCEMSYTTGGCELTRLTVTDMTGQIVFETLVKPANQIVDYNTRFSGITAEDMEKRTMTISEVQAVLLNMFSDKTILMGHSLESDFKALKLIHNTVVDTSVVFPHKLGPPYKRALRNLVSDHLRKIIQNDVGGHDSAEDARSCMELMLWKLKEDAKVLR